MKRIIFSILLLFVISSCSPHVTTDNIYSACNKEYKPITAGKGDFLSGITGAMTNKSYAAYSIGHTELIIMHLLKQDFQDLYIMHQEGEFKNIALKNNMSCSYITETLASPNLRLQNENLLAPRYFVWPNSITPTDTALPALPLHAAPAEGEGDRAFMPPAGF